MFSSLWNNLMDSEKNPLLQLPKTVRFQLMVVLAAMWSIIFCASAGLMIWAPGYMLVHVILLALGIFGTGWVFRINSRA